MSGESSAEHAGDGSAKRAMRKLARFLFSNSSRVLRGRPGNLVAATTGGGAEDTGFCGYHCAITEDDGWVFPLDSILHGDGP